MKSIDIAEMSERTRAAYLEQEFGIITKPYDNKGNEIELFPKPAIQLDCWRIGSVYGHNKTPDDVKIYLWGFIPNHPNSHVKPDIEARTSQVVQIDLKNRQAVTKSGTVYSLGTPEESWVMWLKSLDIKTNWI